MVIRILIRNSILESGLFGQPINTKTSSETSGLSTSRTVIVHAIALASTVVAFVWCVSYNLTAHTNFLYFFQKKVISRIICSFGYLSYEIQASTFY
jgi:hypothetical protein